MNRIEARLYVINSQTFKKELKSIQAYYCDSCKRYYVLDSEYQKLISCGVPCCQIINISDIRSGKYDRWKKTSTLRLYGYNVNKQENLSDRKRHMILDMVIDNKIMTRARCIEFIKWLVKNNAERDGMDDALGKWNQDIDYLSQGKRTIPQSIMIGAIKLRK
ncbi:hypothetical protein SAMN02910292_02698 [Lachnospiraceae bacterium XBB2008]|nr:hypothetical protein SAMN02910292_02698 [Lachnospiraceae bacterium XBB2008]